MITGVFIGVTDKSSVLGNLTSSDFDTIESPTGWLDCNIIQQLITQNDEYLCK